MNSDNTSSKYTHASLTSTHISNEKNSWNAITKVSDNLVQAHCYVCEQRDVGLSIVTLLFEHSHSKTS